MPGREGGGGWNVRVIKPRLPWRVSHPRAAEVGKALEAVLLSKEFALEDAEFQKIVPNEFVIEMHETNYLHNYQPIEDRVLNQWRSMMLEEITTVNRRQGRTEYQLGAPLRLEIHPVDDLKPTEVRILCRVQRSFDDTRNASESDRLPRREGAAMPCLELISSGQRWTLRLKTITIGRDERCNIYLDMPEVQDKRLVSGEHAYLRKEQERYTLYDGTQDGRASVNGTYINRKSVPLNGHLLKEGDEIILASVDPVDPRPDAPGAVTLRFREVCP